VNDHIGFVFFSQTLGFVNGSVLVAVFSGDTFVAFAAHSPITFIRYHVLVSGSRGAF